MSSKKKLHRILDNDYSVRSGIYSAIDPRIEMTMDSRGEYQPVFPTYYTDEVYEKLLKVDMMSDQSENEDIVAKELFGKQEGTMFESSVGYYTNLYIGYVAEGDYRKNGSSGGLTSWILAQLLKQGKVDGIIHVKAIDPGRNNGILFKYVISHSEKDVLQGSKSRYYPMELSEVLRIVMETPGKYAVVGIPEFIMELRLLAKQNKLFKKRVPYMVGLVCGHQKTAKYAEALAWQHGITPGNLHEVDFRVKQPDSTAINYLHRFIGKVGLKQATLLRRHDELYVDNWAAGFFKSKFSDFTDNAFNEVADVVLGDAWLPEYNDDGMGNNIVIVRNQDIANIIKQGINNGLLELKSVDVDTIKRSQLGLIHHIKDELPYRLARQRRFGLSWVPKKRVRPSYRLSFLRKRVQDVRYEMARTSHGAYLRALELGDWGYFERSNEKLLRKYDNLYKYIGWKNEGYLKVIRKRARLRTRVINGVGRIKTAVRIRTRLKELDKKLRARIDEIRFKKADGAIVTLSGYFNYGNVVQRYALQEFLRQNGYNFVSYFKGAEGVDDASFGSSRDAIKQFVHRYIKTKEPSDKDNYSVYITGSDQVWRNWEYVDERTELGYYYLDFVKNSTAKKIAYAASFGVDTMKGARISNDFIKYIKPTIINFSAIAMREKSGVDLVEKTWKIQSRQVVDPTMLLSSDDYSRLIDAAPYKLEDTSGIFAYILGINEAKDTIVNRVCDETSSKADRFYPRNLTTLPPVEQWLKGFRDAELVITDSFHGMVFSIINNTDFIVIENVDGGVARMTSLLEQFGLRDRLVAEGSATKFTYSTLKRIDWDEVNRKLENYRTDSGEWLIDKINN